MNVIHLHLSRVWGAERNVQTVWLLCRGAMSIQEGDNGPTVGRPPHWQYPHHVMYNPVFHQEQPSYIMENADLFVLSGQQIL